MNNIVRAIKLILASLLLVLIVYVSLATKEVSAIHADTEGEDTIIDNIEMTDNNMLIFEGYDTNKIVFLTYEKKATSKISYKTLGWKCSETVKIGREYINTNNYIQFTIEQSEIIVIDSEDGAYCNTVFIIDKYNLINNYIAKRNSRWSDELYIIGGYFQFNAIMTYAVNNRNMGEIWENSDSTISETGKVYHSYRAIASAQNWSNVSGLLARYSINVNISPYITPTQSSYESTTDNTLSIAQSATVTTSLESTTHQFTPQNSIPTGEHVTLTTQASNLQGTVNYQEIKGVKIYPVKVNLSGEYDGNAIRSQKTVYIKRPYSYNKIISVDLYQPDKISIENRALSAGSIEVNPLGNCTYSAYQYSSNIVSSNPASDVTYTADVDIGYITDLSQVDQRIEAALNSSFPNIIVRNDLLIVNGVLIFDNNHALNNAPNPKSLSEAAAVETVTTLITLSDDLNNASYRSNAKAQYKKLYDSNQKRNVSVLGNTNLTIHTPVVSTLTIDTEKTEGSYVLEKEEDYTVSFQNVQHIATRGYGFDLFDKYTHSRYIQLPIPAYIDGVFIPANTWTKVNKSFKMRLPNEVMKNNVTMYVKSIANNIKAVNGGSNIISTELLSSSDYTQNTANINPSNYIASFDLDFKVITDKIEKFNIYDVNDYPFWQSIFRQPDSLKLTGNIYLPGISKEHANEKLTLPFMNGSHLTASNKGVLKLGYTFRYNVTTSGEMFNKEDYVSIIPKFYYVDKDGKNRREVDLYYTETIDNTVKRLIQVGSDTDQNNLHTMSIGNQYHGIEDSILNTTAGIDGISPYEFKFSEIPVYSYSKIKLSAGVRTFTGTSKTPDIPVTDELIRNTQTWYGEYRLPSETYAVPKGYKLNAAEMKNGFTGTEDCWLNDGYIIINFDITGYQYDQATGSYNEFLPYYNPSKNINVWKKEGYKLQKTDSSGVEFNLEYGDIAFLYTIYQKNNTGKYYKVNADQDFNPGGNN